MAKKIATNDKVQPAQSQQDLNEHVQDAYRQAEADIANDADLSIHSPNDDLDEGETARLGDGKNSMI